MRLKKGSAAAKAWGAKMRKLRLGVSSSKSKIGGKMAKRRAVRRTIKRRVKRTSAKMNLGMTIAGGVGYGALRQKISDLIAPLTAKIPGGVYADNLALGIVSYLAAKQGGKLPMGKYIKQLGVAGLTAESVLAGVDLGSNMFKSNGSGYSYFS